MREFDVLKWAAGAVKPAPSINALDEGLLLDLTLYHRLVARVLYRLHKEPQPWETAQLRRELMKQLLVTRQSVRQKIEAVKEIAALYSSPGHPLITIKVLLSVCLDRQTL